ncbi:Hhipl1: HHIP-like 1 [Crotalus adamanteus]|uniref:Hhipl1: HHIP-like 1 n=1 Tax=Crotalus adamanteus TaxID=8729 RepID=A0AAW1C3Z4_CROAD
MNGSRRGRDHGRVESFINGDWGTVCDDLWTSKAAAVVSLQLGYWFVIRDTMRAEFGEGHLLSSLLDVVQCVGHENSFLEPFRHWKAKLFPQRGCRSDMQSKRRF